MMMTLMMISMAAIMSQMMMTLMMIPMAAIMSTVTMMKTLMMMTSLMMVMLMTAMMSKTSMLIMEDYGEQSLELKHLIFTMNISQTTKKGNPRKPLNFSIDLTLPVTNDDGVDSLMKMAI